MGSKTGTLDRVEVTYPTNGDMLKPHSTYVRVKETQMIGHNVMRIVHDNGDVSMVVLGEGFTVSVTVDTAS